MYQALYRKWRPRTFDDVVGQNHITHTLKRQAAENRLSHAYLFTGSRGTGKTSCAKILARAVNCQNPVDGNPCNACPACLGIENGSILDVVELDAATNNGVDQIRALREEAFYSPAAVRKRVYIIDEAHMVTPQAFNALLKILEEPPEHLMFIFATTEVHKILATIRSRCQQFAFQRLSPQDIAERLAYVAKEENLPLTRAGAALLARLADGGMRDALSLLDQCASGEQAGELGEREILSILGMAGNLETAVLMGEIAARDTCAALGRLDRLYAGGKDIAGLLKELTALARDLLLNKVAPQGGQGLLMGGYDSATLGELSETFSVPRLTEMLKQLQQTASGLNYSANRRIDAELCVIRLCDERLDASPAGLNARISRLEAWMAGTPGNPPAASGLSPGSKAPTAASPERSASVEPVPPGPAAPETVENVDLGDFWPAMVENLRGKVPMGEYSYFSTPGMLQGTIEANVLTLWALNDFVKGIITKRSIQAVERAAAQLPGAPYRVAVKVGTPPKRASKPAPAQQSHDRLNDILALKEQYGDIITEE